MASTVVSLGDVAEFIRGINFKPDDVVPPGTPDTVACLRTSNVQAELDLSDVWAVPKPFVKRPEQLVQPGDILVSSANSWNLVGKCCWIPELPWQTSFGGFVSVLRPNPNKVEPRFLYRWFASGRIQALLRSFGQRTTSISNLNIERCRQLRLPLPPLPEQRRIAAILDKADELRAKRRAALEQLNLLPQVIFLELFGDPATNAKGWKAAPLGELCAAVIDCPHSTPTYSQEPTPFACVRSSDIQNSELTLDDAKYVDEAEYQKRVSRGQPQRGDVIYCREGARFGNAARVTDAPICLGQRMMLFRPNLTEATSEFIWGFLSNHSTYREATRLVGGSAAPHVNIRDIVSFRAPLPPLNLQQKFTDCIRAIDSTRCAQRASLKGVEALFSGVQHRAFAGAL